VWSIFLRDEVDGDFHLCTRIVRLCCEARWLVRSIYPRERPCFEMRWTVRSIYLNNKAMLQAEVDGEVHFPDGQN
jgi:hypothetical protein